MDTKKLKMHLEAALACLGDDMEDESSSHDDDSADDDGDDGDMAMKSMKMSLKKYT